MSESYTAALVGGPGAGKVYAVEGRRTISVAVASGALDWLTDPTEVVKIEAVRYEPRTLSFFGKPMHFWFSPEFMGDPTNEAIAQVAAHILSPLGMTLLKEGQR